MTGRICSSTLALFTLAIVPLIGGCAQTHRAATLVAAGQSDYTIVIAPDSSPPQRYAAEELQTFLEQISGARLPVSDQPAEGPMVLVGPSDALEVVSPGIDYEALGEEGLVIKTAGQHLVLTGGHPRGTLYAVYEFLHNHLGCRWFTSGGATPPVTRIPQQETIIVGTLNEMKVPALEYRSAWYREAFDGDWAARNRLNGHDTRVMEKHGGKIRYYRTQGWHTFRYFVGAGELGSHPEYFALNDGERKATQLCTSHPGVVKRVTEVIRHWLSEDPGARFVSVIANDSGGFCGCELCGPLKEYERSRAAPVLHLANQVADSIRDEHPDVMIDTLAYSPTCPTPRFARPRDNVMVRFATAQACRAHPLAHDCGDSWYNAKYLRAWGERCPQMYVWDYVTNFTNYLQPYPNFHTLQPNIKFYLKQTVKGIFNQAPSGGGGEFAELRSYLMARVMWDPDCDFEAQMKDFLQAYYGPAGEPIGKYIEMMREKVEAGLESLAPVPTDVLCPSSGKPMFRRDGELYPFLACDNHPRCKSELEVAHRGFLPGKITGRKDTAEYDVVVLPRRPPMKTDLPCPDCGQPLELRRSHYHGPWTLCPHFPDCLGRVGWSKLEERKRAELETALVEHEKAHPQLKVHTTDGKVYEADAGPLPVPRRQAEPWVHVHMYDPVNSPYLSKDIIDRAGHLFDQAEAAVADDPVLLKRVRKERLGIELVRISRQEEFLPDWQAYEQAVEKFARIAKEWNIQHIHEGGSTDRRLEEWRAKARRLRANHATVTRSPLH